MAKVAQLEAEPGPELGLLIISPVPHPRCHSPPRDTEFYIYSFSSAFTVLDLYSARGVGGTDTRLDRTLSDVFVSCFAHNPECRVVIHGVSVD